MDSNHRYPAKFFWLPRDDGITIRDRPVRRLWHLNSPGSTRSRDPGSDRERTTNEDPAEIHLPEPSPQ